MTNETKEIPGKYFKLEKDLKKAREALSRAYSKYDDRIRSEHMAKKYGL